jgi:hypothetical protein
MADAVDPTIVDFKSEKDATGAKHAVDLCKHAVLQFAGAEMMQDENGDGGGKAPGGERELGGITAKSASGSAIVLGLQIAGGVSVVLEGSDARDGFAELRGGGPIAGANLQKVIAKVRARQDPGEQLPLGEVAPERSGTEEVLDAVHGLQRTGPKV